ncbi:S8 family serine peptidase [Nonomuraea sp. NPDC048826]|uniref:S8 family serine peptidase n=1 Tax=Nonomuraea sp. NPDC048826 TaxID=3364347 RepID=UPI00370FF989
MRPARLAAALLLPCLLGLLFGPATGPAADDDPGAVARAEQWQLDALRVSDAWRITEGEGVLVAVLDTGVRASHPDLRGSVVQGPDLTGAVRTAGRWGQHGTAMASLIAGHGHAARDGSGDGVLGVAPAAEVLSVRVTLENSDPLRNRRRAGGHDALARGIRYAVDRGAQVISMSLGGGSGSWEGSAAEEEAVQYAVLHGVVLVASSGNDGHTTNRKNFPAAYPGVIAVGAVDRTLRPARFSNRQDYLSVVAPGVDIVTAAGAADYVVGDGTSSAAAMVAGIAALIRSAYPELSPYHVRRAIERGTRRRPQGGYSTAYGHGVANAALALREAERLAGPTQAPPLPAEHFGDPRPGPAPVSRALVIAALITLALTLSARILLRRNRR